MVTFAGKQEWLPAPEQLRWIDSREVERTVRNSYVNFEQAAIVVQLLTMWGGASGLAASAPPLSDEAAELMVICMYRPQTKLIHAALQKLAPEVLKRPFVRIITVDAAQGSEADHVVVVTSRSNSANKIGFVGTRNRLNVAISRAKQSLTIIGNEVVLSEGDIAGWGQVARNCTMIGVEKAKQPGAQVLQPAVVQPWLESGGGFNQHYDPYGYNVDPYFQGGAGTAEAYGPTYPYSGAGTGAAYGGATSANGNRPHQFLLSSNVRERIEEVAAEVLPHAQILPESASASASSVDSDMRYGAPSGKQAPGPVSVCSFYLQGRCTRGAACPFQHPDGAAPDRQEIPICKFFQKGKCTRGPACPFRHEKKR